jgi:outer membrane protein
MKMHPLAAASGALLALAAAGLAQAQTRPAAPAAPAAQPAPPQGPALPGVCILSKEGAVYASAVGKAMMSRLEQLSSQADAEINGQKTSLQTDAKTLESQKATIPADQYQQRGQALQVRLNDLQKTAQLRSAEMQLTQKKALQTFGGYMDPVVRQVFTQRNCSVLLDGNALIYPAPGMDITSAVITDLNAKVQSFNFDREHIDPNTGQPTGR